MKYIFLGGQGSGKSTQAKLLADKLHLPYIEMGQIFRNLAGGNDDQSEDIRKSLQSGDLVRDDIVVNVFQSEIKKSQYANGFILDGYPRNKAQMEGLTEDIDKVFYIKVTDGEAIKRLSLRKREDDTFEILSRRLEIYHQQTEPILEEFKNKNLLIEIDGERSIEEIHNDIMSKI